MKDIATIIISALGGTAILVLTIAMLIFVIKLIKVDEKGGEA